MIIKIKNEFNMKTVKFYLVMAIAFMPHALKSSQNQHYFGQVTDSLSGEPLIGVNIYTENQTIGTTSEADGYFFLSLPDKLSDSLTVYFQYTGYQTKKIDVYATNEFQHITLTPAPLNMRDSITIISERFQNDIGLSHQYIQPRYIRNASALGDADLFRYLATQSGVSFTNDISNKIYIRGMRSDKLFILFDDFVLYNPFHLASVTSSIDMGAVQTVELYKSVYPVNETGRTGGMLKLYSKKGNANRFQMNLNVSLMSSILRLQGPVLNGSYFVSLRRTYFDVLSKLMDDEFPYHFYDGIFKIHFKANDNHTIELSGIKSNDYLEGDLQEDIQWSNEAFGVNWKHYYNPRLYWRHNVGYSGYRSSFKEDSLQTQNTINTIFYNGSMNYHSNLLNAQITAGLSVRAMQNVFNADEAYYLNILEQDTKKTQYDAFLNIDGNMSRAFTWQAGVSGAYFDALNNFEILPLVRMQYLFSNSFKMAAGYAKKAQYLITINNEKDILPPFNIWRSLGENTGAEISHQISLSAQYKQKNFRLNTEIYYHYLPSVVDFNRKYIDELDPLLLSNEGESYGLEMQFRYLNSWFDADINYGLSRTIYTMFDDAYYPSFHRLHKFDVNFYSKTYKGWKGALHWVYSSGRPYTFIEGYYFLRHFKDFVTPVAITGNYYSDFNGARYPSYHRLDFRISKQFTDHFRLYVNLINLYNQQNVLYYEYDFDTSTKTVGIKKHYMLPFLPSIGIKYEF
ncbi:MAG: TonB-dependent receptor plug domain-containing protein [Caldithrix sp.]|nr:TonB-dependent receptor plug domain-containing protein [Caldithrix sp.]